MHLLSSLILRNKEINWSFNARMANCLRTWRNALRQRLLFHTKTTNISSLTLPLEAPIEEETLLHYKAEQYYPVNIRDIYNARYQVLGKIGYGAYSTSWLCRDLQYVPIVQLTDSYQFQATHGPP